MRNLGAFLVFVIVAAIAFPVLGAFLLAGYGLISGDRVFGNDDWMAPTLIFGGIFLVIAVRLLIRASQEDGASSHQLRQIERRLAHLESRLNVSAPPVSKRGRVSRDEDSELVQTLHEHGSKMQERLENLETVLIEKARR